jgi:hypothetical protein
MKKTILSVALALFVLIPSASKAQEVDVMALLATIQELYGKQIAILQAQIVEKDNIIAELRAELALVKTDKDTEDEKTKALSKFKRDFKEIEDEIVALNKKSSDERSELKKTSTGTVSGLSAASGAIMDKYDRQIRVLELKKKVIVQEYQATLR